MPRGARAHGGLAQPAYRRRALRSGRGPRRPRQAADRRPADVRRRRPALRRHQRRAVARPGPALAPRGDRRRRRRSPASGCSTWPPAPARRASRSPTRGADRRPVRLLARDAPGRQAGQARTCRSPPATAPGCRSPTTPSTRSRSRSGCATSSTPPPGCARCCRVTRPGGRLVVCEFSHPTWAPFRTVYVEYLMKALPPIARAVSLEPGRLRLPRRVDPRLARPGRPGRPDRRGRLAAPRVAQPLRRHRRPAPRHRLRRVRGADSGTSILVMPR